MAELNIPVEETGPEAPTTETQEQPTPAGEPSEEKFYVPDKFMNEDGTINVKGLAKSYSELEKGRASETKGEPSPPTEINEQSFSPDEILAMSKELEDTGSLSEQTHKILEAKGLPKHMAESYVAGQKLVAEQISEKIMAPVGGQENYQDLMDWAGENMSKEDIASYDKIMYEGDMNQRILAVEGLAARRSREDPSQPDLILGNTGPNQASSAFGSWDQVKRAMRDSRYGTDETYRASVAQRLNMSNI